MTAIFLFACPYDSRKTSSKLLPWQRILKNFTIKYAYNSSIAPFPKDKKKCRSPDRNSTFFVMKLFKIVMELNRAVRFKGQPLIKYFGVGIVAGSGVIGLESGKFLSRMDVDGKAAAID